MLSPHDTTILNGRDVLRDPGLAQLRRYLPVLAVIAAPYAGMGGEQDPLNPLDPVVEWDALAGLLPPITALQKAADARLALVRLVPPTAARLGKVLAAGGPDAFSVVHLVCHGERDMLYLEDEEGSESYAVTEHAANLFKSGSARLVVMDGCFSRTLAERLIRETPVDAVVGTRRRVSPDNSLTFNTRFYIGLCSGLDVRAAYRAAIRELKEKPGGQPDRYEIVLDEDLDAVTLPLPSDGERAARPLVAENAVRVIGLPRLAGFVGRREMLMKLAADLPAAGGGVYVLRGPAGIGKTWLAAAFAGRFGWRFPDGVAWLRCTAMTTVHDVIAALAQTLDMSPYLPLERLSARRVLLVLDQVDAVSLPAEQERLGTLIRALGPGSSVLLTARQVADGLVGFGQGRTYTLEKFTPKDARTLAMRLAVGRGVEALDVDTIDDFLDRTLNFPWLIAEGVDLIETRGIDAALDELRAFDETAADPVGLYLRRKLEWLVAQEDRAVRLLVRTQGLPDGFDAALARGLAGSGSEAHVAALLDSGLLRREEGLYDLPAGVRELVDARFRLENTTRDQIDRVIMTYLAQSWPDEAPQPQAREWQARADNTRALLRRQLHPGLGIEAAVMARLLTAAGPLFRVAGLAEEYLAYAQGFRELLPEGDDLARLQLAMGEVAGALPDQRVESGWLFLVTLRLDNLERPVWTEAQRAFGRHMVAVDQVEAAADALADALRALLQDRPLDVRLAALLAHDWGKTLALLGQHKDAVKRLGAALATYTDLQDAALIAAAQVDLSASLIQVGEAAHAEDLLRQALTTAGYLKRRDLAAQARLRLADLLIERADQSSSTARDDARPALADAAGLLAEAVIDLLPGSDGAALAAAYHRLGQVQARLGQIGDGVSNAARSRDLLARAGSPPEQAEVLVTLGQLLLAQGDSLSAENTLLAVFDLAPDERDVIQRAAGVLVRVHQFRARRVPYGDPQFAQETAARVRASRERLAALGLYDHAAALDAVMKKLP